MKNGNIANKKQAFFNERFKTQERLWDFFVGSPLWAYLIITFNEAIYNGISSFWNTLIPISIIAWYLSLLSIGLFYSFAGIYVTKIIVWLFKYIKNVIKNK